MEFTVQQKTRFVHQPDLVVCNVAGIPRTGSLNEYEAARFKRGDHVRFVTQSGETGSGIVEFTWFFDSIMVKLHGRQQSLCAEFDLIEVDG